ncbi:ABC transporter ATP-binding protein [Pelagovum pacificum]|uniref:sn-glycerol-3-phosphate ABC transporter ATP-binding protein UgpC n=1 Tax=Pelagovum pacificum TaxID=2588711 RepID=A0A5C5G8G7_9RHOB|nr:sn-glycerol-3-phosphate ABC transporter ATP-binding protein UgpC [Pelagovum pacificum]QQA41572.1 sn-glycerol-3-phosphate ABC transporter ATP-binding protein UgpC [Pelagovum pacificum]TNY30851.1 sn-glycerol-3-phosphate ABC transporter ATP-binding protein UgpC [Pelagovum pacificum]
MASVSLSGIEKNYGAVKVIKGIDLTVEEGEFLALVGPSGCGKSTLLRMIAGLEEITSGDIEIGDRIVNDLTPRERNIAMVFQSYALYPHMSVAKNLSFNLELSKVPKDEIARRVDEAARMLELEDMLERKPSQLSGGQRQRVAMGRAIVRNPSVFLFDEPLSNLDAKLRVQMRGEIKTLHKKVGTTSIYVTHDQIEAMTLADRVVVLNGGVIQQVGTPMDLYMRPVNLFVAAFIGSPGMNMLDGEVVRRDGALRVRLADGTELDWQPDGEVREGLAVTVGLRPEHLALDGTENTLTGSIDYVEPTGGLTFYNLDLGQGPHITVAVSGVSDMRREGQMTVSITPDLVHVFDRDTGERISV